MQRSDLLDLNGCSQSRHAFLTKLHCVLEISTSADGGLCREQFAALCIRYGPPCHHQITIQREVPCWTQGAALDKVAKKGCKVLAVSSHPRIALTC